MRPHLDAVAAIAQSMATGDVRMHVLKAMRASRWVEHRLMLADFLREGESESFLRESANALAIPDAEFIARIEALGEIELVVPIREHRLARTGTARIGVARFGLSQLQYGPGNLRSHPHRRRPLLVGRNAMIRLRANGTPRCVIGESGVV